MSVITILHGSRALSDFRVSRLLAKFANDFPQVTDVHSRFVHYIWSNEALTTVELKTVQSLLTYGEEGHDSKIKHVVGHRFCLFK